MTSTKYIFQKLTPINNVDLKLYEDALNYVFQEDDLKNVAITGPYSAGKSSVLETYKGNQPNKRFLNISLAHFESTTDEKKKASNDNIYNNSTLEGKILNQLIHQIKPKSIPNTHFKVKRRMPTYKMLLATLFISLFIVLINFIIGFNTWSNFVQNSNSWVKTVFAFTTKDYSIIVGGIICIALLIYAIYELIKMLQYNKLILNKLKVQGNEIEIFSETDESYFDKYLNEVLYLFENCQADVIVFEDMDRFNSNEIFEKLREINQLVNNKSPKVIRFIYLLRDDVFISKDRTKFFDFIIPIVPIVDGSNSYDQFIDLFKQGGILEKFDKKFLQGLSLYIDDMRLLKNIYNEYLIYYERIQSTELNSNKLLAIISFKNIFPRDFSELQLGRGFVHTLFINKTNFILDEIKTIDKKIQEKEMQIEKAENELCTHIDELDALYFPLNPILSVNRKRENQFPNRLSFIKAMKENPNNVEHIVNSRWVQFDFNNEYNKLSNNDDYNKRKQAVENKSAEGIEKTNKEILELKQERAILENKKLHEIITRTNKESIFRTNYTNEMGEEFTYEDVKLSPYFPLIKYLIRHGYIDETYPDYMTYFYENSLSRIDKIFLRSVADEDAKEYSYALKNPALVVSRLRDVDFDQEETLNFDLLSHLINSNHKNLFRFINQLKENKRFEFVLQFWIIDKDRSAFIKAINHYWPRIFVDILKDSHFSDNQKQEYATDTLYYSPNKDLLELNVDNCLTSYISSNSEFLNIKNPSIELLIEKFSLLNVKFKQVNYDNANNILFTEVYKSDLYRLNIRNIELILEKIYRISNTHNYKHKNFTLVISKTKEPLANYVRNNFQRYIEIVLNSCEGLITDEEEAALEIINSPNITHEQRMTYIKYLETVIANLVDIVDEDIWQELLPHNVLYSEINVINYYAVKKMDSHLIDFINSGLEDLKFDYNVISKDFSKELASNFYKDIVLCEELSEIKYEALLMSLNRIYKQFSFRNISSNKMEILIKCKVVYMNDVNLRFMREHYPKHLLNFISSNIKRYTSQVINKDNFSFDELESLLDMEIKDYYKLKLLKYTSESISIKNKTFSANIRYQVLKYNFDTNDIPYLMSEYDHEIKRLKELIITKCIENIDEVVAEERDLSFNLFVELLKADEIEKQDKIQLLILQLHKFSQVQAIKSFSILDMQDFLNVFSGRWPKFKKTSRNKMILEVLETKGWISSFDTDNHDSNFYRARGRRKQT
ncbi:hypothetical protein [Gracilibacillus lacisalsi]|uniref:YobI family P-loop NTPase n=1 Tax=Gracilibacillus lacisalsi TaxID=393087 RepID=UPI0003735C0D|nr:hypothetical protein [Gracilibacillus lacisalsi]